MASDADRRRAKRFAASLAEEKIKQTLNEISGWSNSDVSSAASSDVCCRLSDFDDLHGHSNKKPRKAESTEEDTKAPTDSDASSNEGATDNGSTKSEGASTESKTHTDSETTVTDPSSAWSFSSEDSSEYYQSLVDAHQAYREQRAQARSLHSGGPMIFSRRMIYKISKADPSLAYSPIAPTRLLLTPANSARSKTNRAH